MTRIMILAIVVMSISVALHSMDFGRKKTGKKLNIKQSYNSESSAEDSDGSSRTSSGRSSSPSPHGTSKLSIKSLNDIGDLRKAKNEITEEKKINKSDGLLDKRRTFITEQK